MTSYNLIVGTFNTPSLYTLTFTPPSSPTSSDAALKLLKHHHAIGSHSWLALSSDKKNLYATAWTEPPTVAAYSIHSPSDIKLLNSALTKSRSGYVCCSKTHVYSAGGATGEVFAIDPNTGALASPSHTTQSSASSTIPPVQLLNFVSDTVQRDDGSTMDFGGLRHGAHSADLSPDGKSIYIADIGRNCIWSYSIDSSSPTSTSTTDSNHLTLIEKHISPRSHDGPRHAWPHPNNHILYVLQEHSAVVDVFSISPTTNRLTHIQGVRIVPQNIPCTAFWADEVRLSLSPSSPCSEPKYLYASTRGLAPNQKGYVAVYSLLPSGLISGAAAITSSDSPPSEHDQGGLLALYETTTSGGWANAIEPGPTVEGIEYLALTDSEVGYVFVLSWDGRAVKEVARVNLSEYGTGAGEAETGKVVGAATAVWLQV